VLLDPGEPDGYLRQWQPPGFPPVRHIAYAVQWFSLAAALVGDLCRHQFAARREAKRA
jgi:cytochrome oxidase assembly protein ShyY1